MNKLNAIRVFSSLAHEGRLDLVRALVAAGSEGLDVTQLSEQVSRGIKTVSAQLKLLASAELVSSTQVGKQVIYRIEFATFSNVVGFLLEDCCCGNASLREGIRARCCA